MASAKQKPRRQPERSTESFEEKIIRRLTDFRDALRSGDSLERRFTARTVGLIPEPTKYDAKAIKRLRESLSMSQAVFARLMGVSLVLVQSWEQGVRTPARMACRLLDEIERNRTYWIGAAATKTA